ncbi:6105_t:CDS:1, partial [Funneliformis mosseae]
VAIVKDQRAHPIKKTSFIMNQTPEFSVASHNSKLRRIQVRNARMLNTDQNVTTAPQ